MERSAASKLLNRISAFIRPEWKSAVRRTRVWHKVLHPLVQRLRPSHVSPSFAVDERYEPDVTATLRRVVEPGWTCVDVGGHIGRITALLAELVGPEGRVITFEAHPDNARVIRLHMEALGVASRVQVENVAVTDGCQASVQLYEGRRGDPAEYNIRGHDVDGNSAAALLSVDAISLDDYFLRRFGGGRVDCVKIDVEGAEVQVLPGMRRLLREYRPIVLVEVPRRNRMGCASRAVCGRLRPLRHAGPSDRRVRFGACLPRAGRASEERSAAEHASRLHHAASAVVDPVQEDTQAHLEHVLPSLP